MTIRFLKTAAVAAIGLAASQAVAGTLPIRIAAYNIDADTGTTTVNDTEMSAVLGAIGNYNPDGLVHPLDILALEETTSNAVTVAPIATDLNKLYPTASYVVPALQPGEYNNSPTVGNGPSSIIYNSSTLQLIGSKTLTATGSSNGSYRQVARYEFEPLASLGGTAAGIFYVYVDHAKSGSTAADVTARGQEATLIRTDADALPVNSRILYVGDFNIGASTEASIVNLEAAGIGQANDPINMPGNYAENSAFKGILTESATALDYRDDLQFVTNNVTNDSTGLKYTTGSYTAFGNNGTTAVGKSINLSSNTALPGLSNRTTVLADLADVTDHLPIVADYTDVTGPIVANWTATTGGSWATLADWSTTIVPTGQASVVTFGSSLTAASGTVTLDGSRTVGILNFSNTRSYTLAAGTSGTLTIDDTGDSAGVHPAINVTAGSHTITAPLQLAAGAAITTATGTQLTLGGAIAGAGTLTIAGTGTVAVSTTGIISLPLAANAPVNFAADINATPLVRSIPAVTVGSNVTVTVTTGTAGRTLLVTPALTVAATGRLDLQQNDIDAPTGNFTALNSYVASGYASGKWNGPGIDSTTAAADTAHITAIGVIQNSSAGSTVLSSFDGRAVTTTDVLVRTTYYGDANLDGVVDGSDYTLIDNGYNQNLTGWFNGDFNYDGVVDGSDYTLIDNAFNSAGGAATPLLAGVTAQIASVPEPVIIPVALAACLVRRRRPVKSLTRMS